MLQLQHDWSVLTGKRIEVRRYGRVIRCAVVDNVMPDGSILWLSPDARHDRRMLDRMDGYEVWSR